MAGDAAVVAAAAKPRARCPPRATYATAVTSSDASRLAVHTLSSWPASPASASFAFATTPTALTGDRFPELAPLITASALRNGESPARRPAAMPIGATSATLAMAPGPALASALAITNSTHGRRRASPFARRSAAPATRSMVPFASASAKSSVTPTRVRNSPPGKLAPTRSAPEPA